MELRYKNDRVAGALTWMNSKQKILHAILMVGGPWAEERREELQNATQNWPFADKVHFYATVNLYLYTTYKVNFHATDKVDFHTTGQQYVWSPNVRLILLYQVWPKMNKIISSFISVMFSTISIEYAIYNLV